jgi:hypothetical protein
VFAVSVARGPAEAVLGAITLARNLFEERHRLAVAEYTHGPEAPVVRRLRALVRTSEWHFDAALARLSPAELDEFDRRCLRAWR